MASSWGGSERGNVNVERDVAQWALVLGIRLEKANEASSVIHTEINFLTGQCVDPKSALKELSSQGGTWVVLSFVFCSQFFLLIEK